VKEAISRGVKIEKEALYRFLIISNPSKMVPDEAQYAIQECEVAPPLVSQKVECTADQIIKPIGSIYGFEPQKVLKYLSDRRPDCRTGPIINGKIICSILGGHTFEGVLYIYFHVHFSSLRQADIL